MGMPRNSLAICPSLPWGWRFPSPLVPVRSIWTRAARCWVQTSLPIGGENSHCVIAGHRSWNGVVCFRPIENLTPGDTVFLTNPWETLSYTVTERKTIAPSQIEEIQVQPGRDLLTLFTCTSPNSQRVLVRCERMQEEVS